MKPESDGEGHDTFEEGKVESSHDKCADSKGVEFSLEVELLVTLLQNIL